MPKHLEKHFPEWQEKIGHLFCVDPDFRAVCNEYEATAKALAFWVWLSKMAMTQIQQQKAECKALLRELETEIRMTLDAPQR